MWVTSGQTVGDGRNKKSVLGGSNDERCRRRPEIKYAYIIQAPSIANIADGEKQRDSRGVQTGNIY